MKGQTPQRVPLKEGAQEHARLTMTVSPKHRHPRESERKHFDVLFIGGGPAVLGVLAHAAKHNRLTELVGGKGVAILQAGPYFGSGALADYLIRSNTSADSFLRVTYKRMSVKKAQSEEVKTPSTGPATFRGLSTSPEPSFASGVSKDVTVCSPFKDLYISELGRCMRQIGKEQASLSLIGSFLSYVGNHLLSYIYHTFKKRIFFPYHRVMSIQQLSSGQYLAHVQRSVMGGSKTVQFFAKSVVIGIGGTQKIPDSLDFKLGIPRSKLVMGELVLKKEGFVKLLQKIEQEKPKNIVIVGGSHTGFSVAWLLLNGPVDYSHVLSKEHANPFYKSSGPFNMASTPISHAHSTTYSRPSHSGFPSATLKRCPAEECGSNGPDCFGKVREPPLCQEGVHYKQLPQFTAGQIKILCRNPVRVYYSELKEAKHDNYEEYPRELYKHDKTTVYPFSGLRGDAKKLYHKIKSGKEERVRLVQIANASAQKAFLNNADLVIWACGFGTKDTFQIYDEKQRRVPLNREPWLVNAHCQMLKGNGDGPSQPFGNMYGIGLGYSYLLWEGEWDRQKRQKALAMRSGELWRNLNVKADSFSYYMTSIAQRLFGRILQQKQEAEGKQFTRSINLSGVINKRKPTLSEAVSQKPLNKQASANSINRRSFKEVQEKPHEEQKRSTLVLDGSINSINRHTSSSLKKVADEGSIRSKSEHTASSSRRVHTKPHNNLHNSPYEKGGPLEGTTNLSKTSQNIISKTTQRRSGEQIVHESSSPKKMPLKKEARYSTPARPKNESALAVGQTAIAGTPVLSDLDPHKIKLKQDYFPFSKEHTPSKKEQDRKLSAVKGERQTKVCKTVEAEQDISSTPHPLPVKTLFYGNTGRAGNVSIITHEHAISSTQLKTKSHTRGTGSAHIVGTPSKPMTSSQAFPHGTLPQNVIIESGAEPSSHSFSTKQTPYQKLPGGYSSSAVVVSKKSPSISVAQRSGTIHRGSLVQKKGGKIIHQDSYSRRDGQYLGLIGQKLG